MLRIIIVIALAVIATISAADSTDSEEDLGVITETVGIYLNQDLKRKDFSHFIVEILPQEWPTNKVSFTKTNNVIKMEDLIAVPHGISILGVRSVCRDGSLSPVRLYKFDLRRDGPEAPKANRVNVYRGINRTNLYRFQDTEELVRQRRIPKTNNMPAIPSINGVPIQSTSKTNQSFHLEWAPAEWPLPGGTNETYSQGIDRMRKDMKQRAEWAQLKHP